MGSLSTSLILTKGLLLVAFLAVDHCAEMRKKRQYYYRYPRLHSVSGPSCSKLSVLDAVRHHRFFGTVRTFYNNNESCSWRIQGPRNKRVQLHFITFSLEYGGETCPYDKVKIYDGRDSKAPLIGTFCGVVFPRVITSSKNALFVIFLTDTRVTSTGFKIRYSIVDHQGDNGDKSHVPCKEALKAVRDKPFKIFKPSCNKKGEYKRKQCHWWAFRCFCVDPTTGVEIKGTNFSIRRTRFPVICG